MAVNVVDAAAAKDLGTVGEATTLIAIGGNANGDFLGDVAVLVSAELGGGGTNIFGLVDLLGQDLIDRVGGGQGFERAQIGAEALALILDVQLIHTDIFLA